MGQFSHSLEVTVKTKEMRLAYWAGGGENVCPRGEMTGEWVSEREREREREREFYAGIYLLCYQMLGQSLSLSLSLLSLISTIITVCTLESRLWIIYLEDYVYLYLFLFLIFFFAPWFFYFYLMNFWIIFYLFIYFFKPFLLYLIFYFLSVLPLPCLPFRNSSSLPSHFLSFILLTFSSHLIIIQFFFSLSLFLPFNPLYLSSLFFYSLHPFPVCPLPLTPTKGE